MTTNDMMTLQTLLEKSSDSDLLHEMIEFAARRLMALEVEGLTGAAHGDRTPDRCLDPIGEPLGGFAELGDGPDGGASLRDVVGPGVVGQATWRAKETVSTRAWRLQLSCCASHGTRT